MSSFNIEKLKFLHVDDFGNYRSMLKAILSSIGAQHMDDAKDAIDAMDKIQKHKYDVILCDYNLGEGQNGQQLLEEAMSRQLLPYGTIFIMITAENTVDMVMAAVEYRPDAYLSKPFPKEVLINRLEKLMEKKQAFKPVYTAYNRKNYSKAIELCDKTMKTHPKLALDLGKLKAEIAIKAKDFDLAESIYDKALDIRPFDWAQYGKGKTLFEKGQYDDAQDVLEDLVSENKNYIEAYDILTEIYKQSGDTDRVQSILQTATTLSPRAISRQQQLGHIAAENGDFKTAEKSLNSSIRLGKHSYLGKMDDHTTLTKLYIDNGQTSKAVKVLNNAKKEYKKDEQGLFHAEVMDSIVQFKQGNEGKAREIFENIIHTMHDEIHSLPESLQKDLISNAEILNENEMVESFKADIENPQASLSADKQKKKKMYKYLLINGKGMRLYKEKKIPAAAKLFDEAAENLPENISVNMNAAQAYIMVIKDSSSSNPPIKKKIRNYLDISKKLDSDNEKYQKLEVLYSGLK